MLPAVCTAMRMPGSGENKYQEKEEKRTSLRPQTTRGCPLFINIKCRSFRLFIIFLKQRLDTIHRIKELADGSIVV